MREGEEEQPNEYFYWFGTIDALAKRTNLSVDRLINGSDQF